MKKITEIDLSGNVLNLFTPISLTELVVTFAFGVNFRCPVN